MKKAIKNIGKTVEASRLGDNTPTERKLIMEGKIHLTDDGSYEIFSLEAVNGNGERAERGDYIKFSSDGTPYPNTKEFFNANHRRISDNIYEQIPKPVDTWTADEEQSDVIRWLIENNRLVINPSDPERYFNAPLWGTLLSAAEDAVIIFYSITRDSDGNITDTDFNFIARDEFNLTYTWL